MSADCDLHWDFQARFPGQKAQEEYQPKIEDENHPALLQHAIFCDVYEGDQIRPRIRGSELWRRIAQNQDERYHHLAPAEIGIPPAGTLPDLYLDFKKTLALPMESLYEGLRRKEVGRVAIVPPIYLHDLIHRFYGFLARVSLPD